MSLPRAQIINDSEYVKHGLLAVHTNNARMLKQVIGIAKKRGEITYFDCKYLLEEAIKSNKSNPVSILIQEIETLLFKYQFHDRLNIRNERDELNHALLRATVNANATIVRTLLHHGADPNCVDPLTQLSPFMLAIDSKNITIINILLESGANPILSPTFFTKLLSGNPLCIKIYCENDLLISAAALENYKFNWDPVHSPTIIERIIDNDKEITQYDIINILSNPLIRLTPSSPLMKKINCHPAIFHGNALLNSALRDNPHGIDFALTMGAIFTAFCVQNVENDDGEISTELKFFFDLVEEKNSLAINLIVLKHCIKRQDWGACSRILKINQAPIECSREASENLKLNLNDFTTSEIAKFAAFLHDKLINPDNSERTKLSDEQSENLANIRDDLFHTMYPKLQDSLCDIFATANRKYVITALLSRGADNATGYSLASLLEDIRLRYYQEPYPPSHTQTKETQKPRQLKDVVIPLPEKLAIELAKLSDDCEMKRKVMQEATFKIAPFEKLTKQTREKITELTQRLYLALNDFGKLESYDTNKDLFYKRFFLFRMSAVPTPAFRDHVALKTPRPLF